MDNFIKLIINQLDPKLAFFLGLLVLGFVVIPKIFDLWHSFIDLRFGLRKFRAEKERLELLKLQFEIAALQKEHQLSDTDITTTNIELPIMSVATESESAQTKNGKQPDKLSRQWNWILRIQKLNYWLARFIIGLIASISVFPIIIGMITVLVGFFETEEFGQRIGTIVMGLAVTAIFGFAASALVRQDRLLIQWAEHNKNSK